MRTECLALTVSVPADEWAYCRRRATYLEALLMRLLRKRANFEEWYDAGQLASFELPGLPTTPAAISRRARAGSWPRRERGHRHYEYHVSVLPARTFDALIARVLDADDVAADIAADLPPPELPSAEEMRGRTAPPWVLPLMRLVKGEAQGDIAAAWRSLADHMPAGMPLPDVEEAAEVLYDLGLAERIGR